MFFTMLSTAFVSTAVIQSPFGFADFLEYAIFALLLAVGVVIARKTKSKAVKILGIVMAVTGGMCLGWLIGWQIIIRLFFI